MTAISIIAHIQIAIRLMVENMDHTIASWTPCLMSGSLSAIACLAAM